MIIAIDFDGTIVKHKYPIIGEDIGAIPVLKELIDNGHKLILYTMRSNKELQEAVDYLKDKGIEFWAINENPSQKHWTSSPKIYANMYIDNAGIGIPLIYSLDEKPFVNWEGVKEMLCNNSIIN